MKNYNEECARAKSMARLESGKSIYWNFYQKGLSRAHFGADYGDSEQHKLVLSIPADAHGEDDKQRRDGYRDGLAAILSPAAFMAVLSNINPSESQKDARRENGKKGGTLPVFAGKIYEKITLIIEDWNDENKADYECNFRKFIDANWNCCHVSERQFRKADGTPTVPLSTEYALTVYSRFCTENGFRNRVKNPGQKSRQNVYLNDDPRAARIKWILLGKKAGYDFDKNGNILSTFDYSGHSWKKRYGISVPLEDIPEAEREKIEKYL